MERKSFRRKCKLCGKMITDQSDAIEYKEGYVHSECFAISLKAVQTDRIEKDQKRTRSKAKTTEQIKIPKKGLSEEEYAEKESFFQSLKELLHVSKLPAKIYAVTERLMKQYGYFTYQGILLTLKYCSEDLGKELTDDCLGLVPFYYDEAMRVDTQRKGYIQNVNDTLYLINGNRSEIVRINPAARLQKKLINLEEIGGNT